MQGMDTVDDADSFSMKIQPKLTTSCVFECFQVAIGHSSELELVLSKNKNSSQS